MAGSRGLRKVLRGSPSLLPSGATVSAQGEALPAGRGRRRAWNWSDNVGVALTLAHEFVYTSGVAQPHINITVRVDPTAMSGATTIKACQHSAVCPVQHTD